MGILRNLLGAGPAGTPGAGGGDLIEGVEELAPLRSPYASAEAAIDEALRARSSGRATLNPPELDRRASDVADRRDQAANSPELFEADRRTGASDRRTQGFGKRGVLPR